MAMPTDIGIVDTIIGFPASDFAQYDFIREQLKDGSKEFEFPVEYMIKQVPKELYGRKDPVALTLHEMDRFGVEVELIGCGDEVSQKALKDHSDRFVASGWVDPSRGMDGALMYPIYAKCVELGVPIFFLAQVYQFRVFRCGRRK